MKTLKAQVIISLITCFFLVLAVTICKGNKFGNILSESENTTESQTGTSGILRHTDDGVQINSKSSSSGKLRNTQLLCQSTKQRSVTTMEQSFTRGSNP